MHEKEKQIYNFQKFSHFNPNEKGSSENSSPYDPPYDSEDTEEPANIFS